MKVPLELIAYGKWTNYRVTKFSLQPLAVDMVPTGITNNKDYMPLDRVYRLLTGEEGNHKALIDVPDGNKTNSFCILKANENGSLTVV